MNEMIKYVIAILNIKTDSAFVLADITEELESVVDIVDYKNFMKKNINYLGMDYYTGFQKFIKLTEIYKRNYAKETNRERINNSLKVAYQLAQKVKMVNSQVEDDNKTYYDFIVKDKCYFTKFEISQLEKIGGLRRCVWLQKSISGDDELLNQLREQMEEMIIRQSLPCLNEPINSKTLGLITKAFNQ